MIPHRIALKGFLSYRDRVELDFRGETLWMLTGPNGAGKSAVFDAMTYALFGEHRLSGRRMGKRLNDELIHKDADALEVVFDFEQSGKAYRIRRTLRRGKSPTQQAFTSDLPPGEPSPDWQPVPGTEAVKELEAWVKDRLGLSYETFTASVLLLQGRAENLIASDGKTRMQILEGVVGIERYRALHERVEKQRARHAAECNVLETQLKKLPEVADEAVAAATERLGKAEVEALAADAEVARGQQLEALAEQWQKLNREAEDVRRRVRQAEEALAAADEIEAGYQRLLRLRELLPALDALLRARDEAAREAEEVEKLDQKRRVLEAGRREQEQAAARLRAEHEQAIAGRRAIDERAAALKLEAQRLDVLVGQLAGFERLARERAAAEARLANLPADLDQRLAEAEAALARAAEARSVWPALQAFHEGRQALREARERLATAEAAVREADEALRGKAPALAELDAQLAGAEATLSERREAAARAHALAADASRRLHQFQTMAGERTCSACGQDLTEEHAAAETGRLRKQDQTYADALRAATRSVHAAEREANSYRGRLAEVRAALAVAEAELATRRRDRDVAAQAVAYGEGACAAAYQRLPTALQTGVDPADWLASPFPTGEDLQSVRQRSEQLEGAQARATQLRQQGDGRRRLQAELHATNEALRAFPAELTQGQALRERHAGFAATLSDLADQTSRLAAESDRLATALRQAEQSRNSLEGDLARTGALLESGRDRLAGLRLAQEEADARWPAAEGPPSPELAKGLRKAFAALERARVEERREALVRARAERHTWQQRLEQLEAALGDVPAEARREPDDVRRELKEARKRKERAAGELREAQKHLDRLEEQRRQRQESLDALKTAEHRHHLCDRLAELLGRKGLQLHLVREAESAIVLLANEVLERLSGGELTLQTFESDEGDPSENALQLQVRVRSLGDRTLHVAQLSGSQKFRVAVSIALAIGQYASHSPRTLECVIIDEGFGSLDREGRQVMIQELHNLKDQLRRIVLVSHQEEFAETFTSGYQLRLQDGTTQVRRIRR